MKILAEILRVLRGLFFEVRQMNVILDAINAQLLRQGKLIADLTTSRGNIPPGADPVALKAIADGLTANNDALSAEVDAVKALAVAAPVA